MVVVLVVVAVVVVVVVVIAITIFILYSSTGSRRLNSSAMFTIPKIYRMRRSKF